RRRRLAGSRAAAATAADARRDPPAPAAREPGAAALPRLRGPALDRLRDPGLPRRPRREPVGVAHPAAGQLPPPAPSRLERPPRPHAAPRPPRASRPRP